MRIFFITSWNHIFFSYFFFFIKSFLHGKNTRLIWYDSTIKTNSDGRYMRLFKIHGITYDCFIYTTKNRSLILHQNFKLRLKYFLRDFLCLHSMWIYKKFFQLSVVINLNYFHFYPVEFLFRFKCYLFKQNDIIEKR